MDLQIVTRPDGAPPWLSRATPGRTHDLTAARAHGIVQACLTPSYGHRELPERYQRYNRDHATPLGPILFPAMFALPKRAGVGPSALPGRGTPPVRGEAVQLTRAPADSACPGKIAITAPSCTGAPSDGRLHDAVCSRRRKPAS
jgi:hypothetical protein